MYCMYMVFKWFVCGYILAVVKSDFNSHLAEIPSTKNHWTLIIDACCCWCSWYAERLLFWSFLKRTCLHKSFSCLKAMIVEWCCNCRQRKITLVMADEFVNNVKLSSLGWLLFHHFIVIYVTKFNIL